MQKKLFAVVLVLALLCTGVFTVAAGSFTDVPADAYYAEAAERMAARGILSGYGDNHYYGNHSVTRAQIAALVCKMLGKVDEAVALAGKTAFTDVPETSWATGYVNYAHQNGIILGDGDGKFRPDDFVKYEEVVKVIVCVLGLDEGVKIDPTDWSKEYLEAAEKAGLLEHLIGKKGEYMLRSDIAVITDAGMQVLDKETAGATSVTTTVATEVTTTKKPSRPIIRPTTTKKPVTTEGPEETTEATTTKKPVTTVVPEEPDEPDEPDMPEVNEPETTTKATTATTRENALPDMEF